MTPFLRSTVALFGLFLLINLYPEARAQSAGEPVPLVLDRRVDFVTRNGVRSFCSHFANDPQSRQKGLMFQTNLPENAGMLFDFKVPQPVNMWMLNTILSLDMIFISGDNRVLRIAENTTPYSREIISSGAPALYVLEVNAGRSREVGIAPGDRVSFVENGC